MNPLSRFPSTRRRLRGPHGPHGPLWLLWLFVVPALSGCSGGDEPLAAETLSATQGGIQGLLVDDRFRPLELTDSPQTEFQFRGFVLVQETGARLRTDANGQFRVLGLAPGTYTLRPSIEGHEGSPVATRVGAGVFTDATVVVRRVESVGEDFALIYDTTVLMVCMSQTGNVYGTYGTACFLDTSGEAEGSWIYLDLEGVEPIEAIVFEFEFGEIDDWSLSVHPAQGSVSAVKYAIFNDFDTDYTKHIMVPGETYTAGTLPTEPFDPYNMEVWIRRNHAGAQETFPITGEALGVGFTFQTKARSVTTVFLDAPDDLEGYALLA